MVERTLFPDLEFDRLRAPIGVRVREILPPAVHSWYELRNNYGSGIPRSVLDESEQRVMKAVADYGGREELVGGRADSAFLIHTRRVEGSEPYLDDPGRCLPALDEKYGIPYNKIEKFWNLMPPFEVGKIKGVLQNGSAINLSIISVPITPQKLEEFNGSGNRIGYARPKIEDSVALAKRFGARVVGLGETLASLTNHAKSLSEKFPDLEFATGHAFTTHYILEWVRYSAQLKGNDVKNTSVTVIGADGSIGSSTVDILAEEGVGQLVLHDVVGRKNRLIRKSLEMEERYPYLKGRILVTGGDEELGEACKRSQIIVCASSNTEPFIKASNLNPGSIIINDSQPPGISREEARKANSISPWVVGKFPEGVVNTFDYGLVDAEWTCALEVIAKTVGNSLTTVGPVTPARVRMAGEVARNLGFSLPQPQSFGEVYPLDIFNQT